MKSIVIGVIAILLVVGVTWQVTRHHGTHQEVSKVDSLNPSGTTPGAETVPGSTSPTGAVTSAQNQPGSGGTTPGGSVPGGVGVSGQKPGDAGKASELTSVKVDHNCFAFEYRHKKEALSRDIEDFLDLSNAFPVLHKDWNQKSMCVKVNQKPIAYKVIKNKGQDEVLVGSVVGPESVIRVSYCTGKAVCKESCNPPKKRFMDDLEEEANADEGFQDSWGAGDEKNKKELKAKAKELRSVASENRDLDSRSIERDWDTLNHNEWTCKEK